MKSLFVKVLLLLVFVLLAMNLVAFFVGGQSVLKKQALDWIVAGLGAAMGIFANGAGIWYTTRARRKRDKSSFTWARRAFAVGLTITVLIIVESLLPRPTIKEPMVLGAALALLNAAPCLFLVAFVREYLRTAGRESRGKRRSE
jgi:archaellum biogenesis protein FlaJ (TadC family)